MKLKLPKNLLEVESDEMLGQAFVVELVGGVQHQEDQVEPDTKYIN